MIANTVAFLTCADSDNRPNIMTLMPIDFISFKPYLIGVSISTGSYSHRCISEAGCFSLSVPTGALAKHLNYCGIVSGCDVDKFEVLQLATTPGSELGLPMIDGCIRYYECRVKDIQRYGSHDLFVAERTSFKESPEIKNSEGETIVSPDTVPVVSYTGYDFWCLGKKVWDHTTDSQHLLEIITQEKNRNQ